MARGYHYKQVLDWQCAEFSCIDGGIRYTLANKKGGVIHCTTTSTEDVVRKDIQKTLARLNKIYPSKVL